MRLSSLERKEFLGYLMDYSTSSKTLATLHLPTPLLNPPTMLRLLPLHMRFHKLHLTMLRLLPLHMRFHKLHLMLPQKSLRLLLTMRQNLHTKSQNLRTKSQNLHTKSPNLRTKSQNFHTKSQNFHTKSPNLRTKSQNLRTKSQPTRRQPLNLTVFCQSL